MRCLLNLLATTTLVLPVTPLASLSETQVGEGRQNLARLGTLGDRFLATVYVTQPAIAEEAVPPKTAQILGASAEFKEGSASLAEPWNIYAPETVILQKLAQVDKSGSEADLLFQQGIRQYNQGLFREALASWERALQLYREIENHWREADSLGNLGLAYDALGQYELAIGFHQQSLALEQELGDRQGQANSFGNLGIAHENLGDYAQAIYFHERSLEIFEEINNQRGQANSLSNLGVAYGALGQYEKAIDFHQQSLAITREIRDLRGEANSLGNLGIVYDALGQYEKAIDFHQQSLAIAREIGDLRGEADSLGNLGIAYDALGKYEQAIDFHQQSFVIAHEIGDQRGQADSLGNLGLVYNALGQYEQAIDFYQQSLAIAYEIGDRRGQADFLNNLGITYDALGQYEQAIYFYQQSLAITREIGDQIGEGRTLSNLGITYNNLDRNELAVLLHQQSLAIALETRNLLLEAASLDNLGNIYLESGEYERAIDLFQRALALTQIIGIRAETGSIFGNIGYASAQLNQIQIAIVFLKASVEVRESIRGDIRGLDTNLQQSFADTVADDYRLLADLLLQQNRIIEAQRVLDLLKVQELDDYLQDVQRNAQTETGVDFWQPEERILALYQDVLLTGTELTQLQSRNPASLSSEEQARLAELTAQQDQLYTNFVDWLTHPEIVASIDDLRITTRGRTIDVENFTDLQHQLAQLPQASVILYPLILEDRLELVLVSADAPPVRYPVDVDAVTLNRAIVAFGQAIKDRGSDARSPAQQLYDWVIAPLEADLTALGTENIIFAPDGALRYVPLAALYDGDQWLVERFTFSQITAASETDFAAAPRDRQSLLAAACANCAFTVEVGEDSLTFGHLPATRQEVNTLATQIPGATVLIDSDFTPQQFKDQLGSHNWIHLATHGFFVADDPDASFLLFGNGETVNLRQVFREWQQMDADLVVLSACETALGGPELGSGIEVLGLGFQMQRVGAKAVMASLWVVSDRGTQALMEHFYAALNQGITKAEALQAAQLAMITGNQVATTDDERAIAVVADAGADASAPRRAARYSHPYYWAPFILIGNGL